jgi:hypothetical protein
MSPPPDFLIFPLDSVRLDEKISTQATPAWVGHPHDDWLGHPPESRHGFLQPRNTRYTLLDFEVSQVSRQRLRLQKRQSIFPTRKGAQRRTQTGGTLRGGESYTMRCARWLKQ